MKIYLQSRGYSGGYSWVQVTPDNIYQETPSIFSEITNAKLIYTDAFALILIRDKNQLSLIITGLESSKKDIVGSGRVIRHSIVWVGEESDELLLRQLVSYTLRGSLQNDLDRIINTTDEGFEIDFNNINSIEGKVKNLRRNIEIDETDSRPKIGNLNSLKNKLAKELESCTLPDNYKFLMVLVSCGGTQKTLEEIRAWRSLSNSIKSEGWQLLSSPTPNDGLGEEADEPSSLVPEKIRDWVSKLTTNFFWIFLVICSLMLVILVIFGNPSSRNFIVNNIQYVVSRLPIEPPPTPTPTQTPTPIPTPTPTPTTPIIDKPSVQCELKITEEEMILNVKTQSHKDKTLLTRYLRFPIKKPDNISEFGKKTEQQKIMGKSWKWNFKDIDKLGKPLSQYMNYAVASTENFSIDDAKNNVLNTSNPNIGCKSKDSQDDGCIVCLKT